MEWLLIWLGVSIAIGFAANSRGRNGFGWFLLSLLLSPLISGLLLLLFPRLKAPDETVRISRREYDELQRNIRRAQKDEMD